CNVDSVGGCDPGHKQGEQERAESENGAERRCAQHVHSVPRSGFLAALPAAAEFVETERRKRTDQRKTGGQRKQQRQHGMAKGQSEQNKTENGINYAQDNGVSWYGLEVFPAQAQRVAQVGKADFSNDECAGDAEQLQFRSCEILYGHGPGLLARGRRGKNGAPSNRAQSASCAKIAIEPGKSSSTRRSFAGRHLSRPVQ